MRSEQQQRSRATRLSFAPLHRIAIQPDTHLRLRLAAVIDRRLALVTLAIDGLQIAQTVISTARFRDDMVDFVRKLAMSSARALLALTHVHVTLENELAQLLP